MAICPTQSKRMSFHSTTRIAVPKTIISKRDLDALIRNRLETYAPDCNDVTPLPIVWRARMNSDANWAIPGWTGDSDSVQRCTERIRIHLRELRGTYDIPDEQ